MNTRVAGLLMAVVAVCGGVVTVGCTQSVSGRAVVNETERAAYVTAAAATSSSKAKAARGAVCAEFVVHALKVQGKIDALKRRLDEKADRTTTLGAARDAGTALDDASEAVASSLRNNSVDAGLNTTMSEYSTAAEAFGKEMTKMSLGTGDQTTFATAQTRYFAAKNAGASACGPS
ncbi:hypothetical protein [Nocardia lasii]|uniref:Lipoprotein n=1 Tax=Nocardia lasii TaxID=1616107 RepID=A0ABW1JV12_9NOCA